MQRARTSDTDAAPAHTPAVDPPEPPRSLHAAELLARLDEHRRGMHATVARADCSRCVVEPLLPDESDVSGHEIRPTRPRSDNVPQ